MDYHFPVITWGGFLYYCLLLALLYALLWVAPLPIRWLTNPGIRRRRWLKLVLQIRTAYEPIALVLGVIALVCVNPIIHGVIVAGLIVLSWAAIRNYVDGQLLRLTTPLSRGQEITADQQHGTVQAMHPTGLVLQTEDGSRIVPYRNLRESGFTISRGARISGWQEFTLQPTTEAAAEREYLRDRLFNCPYLNWGQQPEIKALREPAEGFSVRLLLEDNSYHNDLYQLLAEWGYTIAEKPDY